VIDVFDVSSMRDALARALGDPDLEVLVPAAPPGGPLRTQIEDDGVVVATLVHGRPADPDLLDAACVLVRAALRQQRSLRRIAREADRERARIERDLHDGAQQRLIALRIKLALADELLGVDVAAGRRAVAELGGEVELALEELRALAHGVYPPLLRDGGVADALRGILVESPLPVHLRLDGVSRHAAELEAAVYFACLEALQNANKHAHGASAVWITLVEDATDLMLEIRDDGPGFAPGRSNGGLRNMRDRFAAVGGWLTIDSTPGHGVLIVGTIPLSSQAVQRPQEIRRERRREGAGQMGVVAHHEHAADDGVAALGVAERAREIDGPEVA
jgi:signal transduction histidine kinase